MGLGAESLCDDTVADLPFEQLDCPQAGLLPAVGDVVGALARHQALVPVLYPPACLTFSLALCHLCFASELQPYNSLRTKSEATTTAVTNRTTAKYCLSRF